MSMAIDDNKVRAILTDTTLCTGCETCVAACKKTYNLGRDRMWRWKDNVDSLSSTRFCTVQRRPDSHYVRQQCRHCNQPACASACIVGALKKEDIGPVTYDSEPVHGLPLLHDGVPVRHPALRVGERRPQGPQVHPVLPAAAGRQAAGLHRGLPVRGDHLRHAGGDARRGPPADRGEPGPVLPVR